MSQMEAGALIHGRYRIGERIGSGGMATAYRAEDLARGGAVALKFLDVRGELLDAFRSEFALLTRLRHPHLLRVHDFGLTSLESCFYTADLIEGTTLGRFAEGAGWAEVSRPLADAIEALSFLHLSGIRHGDFKPDNVLVTTDGRGVLIDLGCARPLRSEATLEVSGTKGFIAPELLAGRRPGARADLYGVGVTISTLCSVLKGSVPETVGRLGERLREPDESRRPADALEVLEVLGGERPAALAIAAPLLGRQRELELVEELLQALREGREAPRALWLFGADGIGRSRLLQEMKWTCQLRAPVFEAVHTEGGALREALVRAVDAELPLGLEGLLEARELLHSAGKVAVVVVDDVHRLKDGDRFELNALLRSMEQRDSLLLLLSSADSPQEMLGAVQALEVGPLGLEELAEWSAGLVSPRNIPVLMGLSGGFPSHVERLLSALASGRIREDELGLGSAALRSELPEDLEGLTGAELRALSLLTAADGYVTASVAESLSVHEETLEELHRRRFLVVDSGGWRLWRVADVPTFRGRLDQSLLAELHAGLAHMIRAQLEHTEPGTTRRSQLQAELVCHLVRSGSVEEARGVMESTSSIPRAPRAWVMAADVVAASSHDPEMQTLRASIYNEAGYPDRAIAVLSDVLWSSWDVGLPSRARLEAAKCYLKLGELRRCLRQIRVARAAVNIPEEGAALAELQARALIQKGLYKEARDSARSALQETLPELACAGLHEDIGVSSSYLGEHEMAAEELRMAAELLGPLGSPRDRVRLLSYRAINEYRRGRIRVAADAYDEALTTAERNGLVDQIASAALNLGTACHQQGDLGRALDCYGRGLRTAVALGAEGTALHLRLNIAKLYADVGSFDRAEAAMVHLARGVEGLEWLGGVALSLQAQIAAGKGESQGARALLVEAREAFVAQGALREVTEVDLERAELEWRSGRYRSAEEALLSARSAMGNLSSPDLKARVTLAAGRLRVERGHGDQALRDLEEARLHARETEQRSLEAEVEEALADACELQGARFLVRRHRARARELWERVATTLPASFHDAFWRHPKRSELGEIPDEVEPASASRALRLMEINRQLGSSLRTEDVLRHTMDAAIELSGAERGFVILRRESKDGSIDIHIPIARNLDREQLGRSHLKLSRSIAEKVLQTGEEVLSVDALADDRFRDNVSVHAMRLRSVACVPIRSGEGILGALYLDNRFQRGRFRKEDTTLLLAFADQAAIALRNARLLTVLEERTKELEAERKKVDALVREQAEEIDRLSEEVQARQPRSLTYRHDFSQIVGRGTAMQEVLSLLERVIEAPWPILIQGESGTGKELIARAVHNNGPRSDGPFVTVNCAALPAPLLESELFGHVKGSFTGATRDRKGLFVEARGGTLFLDEIGEMPIEMQSTLLRVLEEREVRPVGSEEVVPVDVRLLCATNRRLRDEVEAGRFREDLFYRVAVMELSLPALRERVEDIPALAKHLLVEAAREMGRSPPELGARGLRKLARYSWPGNVRQLRNVLSKALVLAEGNVLTPGDIELPRAEGPKLQARTRPEYEKTESSQILAALNTYRWNVAEVSRALGIPRSSLYRKLKKYGLAAPPKV